MTYSWYKNTHLMVKFVTQTETLFREKVIMKLKHPNHQYYTNIDLRVLVEGEGGGGKEGAIILYHKHYVLVLSQLLLSLFLGILHLYFRKRYYETPIDSHIHTQTIF